jgi:hypothetical protein
MPVRTCDHLKEDGVYCGSPALHGRNYCYFHLNLRGRRLKTARARRRGDNPALNLPFPEDMHAVQVSLAEIMWAVAEDRIDTKRAWAILNSLQQASTNLNRTPGWQGRREAVPATRPLRALTDPNFERRHGLPRDIDLNSDPDRPLSNLSSQAGGEDSLDPTTDNWPLTTDVCHPERSRPSLAAQSKDAPLTCHPERSRPSLAAESKDPYPANHSLSVDPGCPVQAELERGCSPDRVPVPADQLRELNMTHWEKLEFFIYKLRFDRITDEQEQRLKVAWLREKRRLTRAEYLAAQRDSSEEASTPMDGPDYTDHKQMPFGFGNTLEDAGDDEEDEGGPQLPAVGNCGSKAKDEAA